MESADDILEELGMPPAPIQPNEYFRAPDELSPNVSPKSMVLLVPSVTWAMRTLLPTQAMPWTLLVVLRSVQQPFSCTPPLIP